MHFKIEKSGCVEHRGLCQMRADFYYDETDKAYALTDVKIFPPEGYQGKVEGVMKIPVDMEDYNKWYDALPTEKKLLPCHTHFIYFPNTASFEEMLFCFELALDWFKKSQPLINVKPIFPLSLEEQTLRVEAEKLFGETKEIFATTMTESLAKYVLAKTKIASVLATDFTKISDLYSVK